MVSANVFTGANRVRLRSMHHRSKPSVFDRLVFPRETMTPEASVDDGGSPSRNSNFEQPDNLHCNLDLHLCLHGNSHGTFAAAGSVDGPSSPVCARCLAPDHSRSSCTWPIKCRSCFNFGHVSAFCRARKSNGRPILAGPKDIGPPVLSSFGEFIQVTSGGLVSRGASSSSVTIP